MTAWRRYDVRGETAEVLKAGQAILDAVAPEAAGRDFSVLFGHDGSTEAVDVASELAALATGLRWHADARTSRMTTPALYWGARHYDLGIMVTASHDGRTDWTGLKATRGATPWGVAEYTEARQRAAPGPGTDQGADDRRGLGFGSTGRPWCLLASPGPNRLPMSPSDEAWAYIRSLGDPPFASRIERPVAVLAGSNVAADFAERAFKQAGSHVGADVYPGLNPSDVLAAAEVADLGDVVVLLDADADRMGVVIDGEQWTSDEIGTALAWIHQAEGFADFVTDLRASREWEVPPLGRHFYSDSGRAMTPACIDRFGAESSGHYYSPCRLGFDDGLWAALQLVAHLDAMREARAEGTLPTTADPVSERVIGHAADWRSQLEEEATSGGGLCRRVALGQDHGGRWRFGDGSWVALRVASDDTFKAHWQGRLAGRWAEAQLA